MEGGQLRGREKRRDHFGSEGFEGSSDAALGNQSIVGCR